MGCSLRGPILFPFTGCKCNDLRVNKYIYIFFAIYMISYPLRSGKELFNDSGDKQSLDTNIFIHS